MKRDNALKLIGNFEKIARALTSKYDVKVVASNSCCTDGTTIYYPANADKKLEGTTKRALAGMMDHETGHIVEERRHRDAGKATPLEILKTLPDNRTKMIFNAVEDLRMENRFGQELVGVRDNLREMNQIAVEQIKENCRGKSLKDVSFWHSFGCGIIAKYRGLSLDWIPAGLERYLDAVAPEIAEISGTNWAEETAAIAYRIIDKVKSEKEAAQGEGKENSENNEEKGKNDVQKNRKNKKQRAQSHEDSEKDADEDTEGQAESGEEQGEGSDECEDSGDPGDSDGDPGDGGEGTEDASDGDSEDSGVDQNEGEENTKNSGGDQPDGEESGEEGDGEQGDGEESGEGAEGEQGEGDSDGEDSGDSQGEGAENTENSGGEQDQNQDSPEDGGPGDGGGYGGGPGADADIEKDPTESDLTDGLRDRINREADADNRAREYRKGVNVTDITREHDPRNSLSKAENEQLYTKLREIVNKQIVGMRSQLVRILQAKSVCSFKYGQEEGEIDETALWSAEAGNRKIFQQEVDGESIDTAIQILVDMSGSMGCDKADLANKALIALSETFESIGISYGIMGFHTLNTSYLGPGEDYNYYRTESQTYEIFKEFHEKLKRVRNRFGSWSGRGSNADPDAVLEAAKRLVVRPEKRKILFVLSDGLPAIGGVHDYVIGKALSEAVKLVTSSGIEVISIGILDESVRDFYNDKTGASCEVIRKSDEISTGIYKALKNKILQKKRTAR